jgi:electron transfer flavoprotein beta subunit
VGGRICVCVAAALDEHAVEQALRVRDSTGWEVVVVSMAPASRGAGIQRALAMGADRAVHVADPALAGSDLVPTSRVLTAVLAREAPDLVVLGAGDPDNGSGMLPGAVSERLGWPLLSRVTALTISGDRVRGSRRTDRGGSVVEAGLPAVVSLAGPVGTPRHPVLSDIAAARRKRVDVVTSEELGLSPEACGLPGSGTRVLGVQPAPVRPEPAVLLDGPGSAERLFEILQARGVRVG